MNDSKIREVAAKHGLPVEILSKAVALEKERITMQNRRMVPKLRDLISEYSELASSLPGENA